MACFKGEKICGNVILETICTNRLMEKYRISETFPTNGTNLVFMVLSAASEDCKT